MAGQRKHNTSQFSFHQRALFSDDFVVAPVGLSLVYTEISSGLGALSGKIVRIGLMGYNARAHNVEFVLNALKEITNN